MLIAIILLALPPLGYAMQSIGPGGSEDFGWLGSVVVGLPCLFVQVILLITYQSGERWADHPQQQKTTATVVTLITAAVVVLRIFEPVFG